MLEGVWREVRLAGRSLAQRPVFALTAILTLGVAIGANTAVFSVVDAVLLRPLPFPEPERLSFLTREGDVSVPDGVDWRAESRTFEDIALFLRQWNLDLTGDGDPQRIFAAVVEPRYFRILKTKPLLGRTLGAEDDRLGAEPVAVLSEAFWRERFGADPGVLGRSLVLSGQATTVVGVMPASFDFLDDHVDLWSPVATTWPMAVSERGTNNFDAIGRLREGVSLEAARAEIVAITTRLAQQYPKSNARKIVEPMALHAFVTGPSRPALVMLLGAVLLVALAASANVAALLLARHVARGGEYALRLAIGAGSGRLFGQVLAESVVLALAGGALGTALAAWGRDALLAMAPASLPRAGTVALDARVLGFTFGLSLTAALLAAALPALLAARTAPGALLAGAGRGALGGRATGRALSALVVGEVALAGVLLIGALLLVRSFLKLQSVPLGFDPRGTLIAEVVLPESRYGTRPPQTRAVTELIQRLQAAPGVEAAAWVTTPPLDPRGGLGGTILIEGRSFATGEQPGARVRFVHGDYFGVARIPLVSGRGFAREDEGGQPISGRQPALRQPLLAGGQRGRPAHRVSRLRRRRRAVLDDDRGNRLRHQGSRAERSRHRDRLRAVPAAPTRMEPLGNRGRAGQRGPARARARRAGGREGRRPGRPAAERRDARQPGVECLRPAALQCPRRLGLRRGGARPGAAGPVRPARLRRRAPAARDRRAAEPRRQGA